VDFLRNEALKVRRARASAAPTRAQPCHYYRRSTGAGCWHSRTARPTAAHRAQSLDTIDTLTASNDSLSAELKSVKAALALATATQAAVVANAGADAANACASVARTLKSQLIYRGGSSSLRAEVVNLSAEAFAIISAGRGKSFNIDESGFTRTFGSSSLYKCLRYGSVLVPVWPVRAAPSRVCSTRVGLDAARPTD
jgi:hypothetical protein